MRDAGNTHRDYGLSKNVFRDDRIKVSIVVPLVLKKRLEL